MTDLKSVASRTVDQSAEELHSVSQYLWNNPELAFDETEAHKLLTGFLEKRGFAVERCHTLTTAFRAVTGSQLGPHVVILCEYDALPGVGHACGHNLIAEVGVAAGVAVKAALEASGGQLIGKLTVLGAPAEESGGGKVRLLKEGVFDGVDVAMMAHPANMNEWRPKMLAVENLYVSFRGKPSHSSAAPWDGVNALDAAVLFYQNVSCLRQQMKPTSRLHGIILKGGDAPNIIPEFTQLLYFVRAPTTNDVSSLMKKVKRCAEGAAEATGCMVEFKEKEFAYQNLVTNETLIRMFEQNISSLGAKEFAMPSFSGSTDMGDVSHAVPSIHPLFYIGTEAANHTKHFTKASGSPEAQPYTLAVAKAVAMTVIDVYQQPELLRRIQEDFKLDIEINQV